VGKSTPYGSPRQTPRQITLEVYPARVCPLQGFGDFGPRYARPQHARRLCVRRIVEMSPTLQSSMIVWFQNLSGRTGRLLSEATRSRASLMGEKYNTATLPASQLLFFRGENHARAQTSAGGIVKPDGNQAAIHIAHPDGLIVTPLGSCSGAQTERDTVKRPQSLVRP
jgi:hypothetical protein